MATKKSYTGESDFSELGEKQEIDAFGLISNVIDTRTFNILNYISSVKIGLPTQN